MSNTVYHTVIDMNTLYREYYRADPWYKALVDGLCALGYDKPKLRELWQLHSLGIILPLYKINLDQAMNYVWRDILDKLFIQGHLTTFLNAIRSSHPEIDPILKEHGLLRDYSLYGLLL